MPFVAINSETKERVNILHYEDPKVALADKEMVCQDCGVVFYIRGGRHQRTHFAHMPNIAPDNCFFRIAESGLHLQGKELIKRLIEKSERWEGCIVELEHRVDIYGDAKRFIDVAVIDDGQVTEAHEVQLSSQSVDEYERRTEEYRSLGIETFWWNGPNNQNNQIRNWLDHHSLAYGIIEVEQGYRDTIVEWNRDQEPDKGADLPF